MLPSPIPGAPSRELRELRKQVTFAVFAEQDDLEKVTATVEALFTLLQKSFRQ